MPLVLTRRLITIFELFILTAHLPQHVMSQHHPCHNTSRSERLWFMWLWSRGVSVRNIAKRARRSPTTVKRWVKRLRAEQHTPCAGLRVLLPPPCFHRPADNFLHRPHDIRFNKVCNEKYINDMLLLTYNWNLYVYYQR